MTLIHLLEASDVPAFTLQQGGWITAHKRQLKPGMMKMETEMEMETEIETENSLVTRSAIVARSTSALEVAVPFEFSYCSE